MSDSNFENKTPYELHKDRQRFGGWEGQTQGVASRLDVDWVPKAPGTFAYPVVEDGNPKVPEEPKTEKGSWFSLLKRL